MQLDGRRILITGAGSGIGRAVAQLCAARGASLILAGRRDSALRETAALLPDPARAIIVPADITTTAGRAAIHQACSAAGCLDILVNNAGIVANGAFAALDDAALAAVIATNLTAPAALIRDLLPLLCCAESARIVNVGSIFGDIGHPLFAAYSASKFALRGLSDALRRELAPEGIGVTYVAPRATRTAAADGFSHLIEPFAMKTDSPKAIAAQIVAAIERQADVAYARGPERFFVLVQRLLPKLVDQALIRKFMRYAQASA